MMRAAYIRALAAIIGLSGPVAHCPQTAAALPASTLPDAYAGLSPSGARELRAEIERLARERDVREATLVAIAARLRVDYQETSFATLLEVLDNRATEAEQLRAELSTLRARFELIPARLDREAAQDLLSRASAALDAGDLDLADQLLAELVPLRGGQLLIGVENWEQAVAARARVLVLSGRVRESVSYRREASSALEELTRQTRFRLMLAAAEDAFEEGKRLPGLDLLQTAIDVYEQDVFELVSREGSPVDWAGAHHNLGNVLSLMGQRTVGNASTESLKRALKAYSAALEIRSLEESPYDWAQTQNSFGTALRVLGGKTRGEAGMALIARATASHQESLKVFTKQETPEEWAMAQLNMGNALLAMGMRTPGDAGSEFLRRAKVAHESSLEMYKEQSHPYEWAIAQTNLASSLQLLGVRTPREAGRELLVRAVKTIEETSRVFTQIEYPADWAMIQNNLGVTLHALALRTSSDAGVDLITRAVAAYEAALIVRTKEAMPADWGMTQHNLGKGLAALGERTGGKTGMAHLVRAVAAYRSALEVRSSDEVGSGWVDTQIRLAEALGLLGERVDGEAGAALLLNSINAYELGLEFYESQGMADQQLAAVTNIGGTYFLLWHRADELTQKRVYAEAALKNYVRVISGLQEDSNHAAQIKNMIARLEYWIDTNS